MFSFTTVTHTTDDTAHPAVLLTNRDGYRFFFGKVPEGTQRVLNENGMKLAKLQLIFLTGTISHWLDIGGLPGLFLTLSDATNRGIDVFVNSSRIMSYVISTWRYFVFRKGLDLNLHDVLLKPYIADSSMAIRPVLVECAHADSLDESLIARAHRQLKKITALMLPRDTSRVNDSHPDSYKLDPTDNAIHTHVKLPSPKVFGIKTQPSLCYVIRFLPVRGKFDPKTAVLLGVEPGIKFKELTMGNSVLNKNNEKIEPAQVLGPDKTCRRVAIIDIPSQRYLASALATDWNEKSQTWGDEEIGLVYHFLGHDIDFTAADYRAFIESFPADCKHVINHPLVADNTLVFKTAALHTIELKKVLRNHFNLPNMEPCVTMERHSKLQALQVFTVDANGVTEDNLAVINESLQSLSNIDPADAEPVSLDCKGNPRDEVQVITLGTGSALPSMHRNVISTLVRVPYISEGQTQYRSVLLDGGENTIGALRRNFGHNGRKDYVRLLQELRLIYLSHLHADHDLGLVLVISAWMEVNETGVLYVVLPWQFDLFLRDWANLQNELSTVLDLNRIRFLSCEEFVGSPDEEFKQLSGDEFEKIYDLGEFPQRLERRPLDEPRRSDIAQLYSDLKMTQISNVRAIHCYWAYSTSMTFQLGNGETFKLSYSGDTRPNERFCESGKGSDLLIHEATLEDEWIEEAVDKKHSTAVEAIRVCQLMKCPKLILTHFSTRYADKHNFLTPQSFELYLGEHKKNFANAIFHKPAGKLEDLEICYLYDLMMIKYKDVNCQLTVIPELEKIQADDHERFLKRQKEKDKQVEKQEAKRLKRLSRRR